MTVLRFFVESTFGRQRHLSFLEDMGVGGRIVGFHIENLYIFWYNVNRQNYVFLTRETSENFLHITPRIERKKFYLPVNMSKRTGKLMDLKNIIHRFGVIF